MIILIILISVDYFDFCSCSCTSSINFQASAGLENNHKCFFHKLLLF